jgi:capsular polysaccharide export protein
VPFRGRRSAWPEFLADLVARHDVTDMLYYGDRMPYHAAAAEIAVQRGIRADAVEFGYLRPGWLTLERGGMGAYSHFPDDPALIASRAAGLPPVDGAARHGHAFAVEAFNEVAFNLLNSFDFLFYPAYDPDRFYAAVPEYLSSFLRTWWRRRQGAEAGRILAEAAAGRWPYGLYALQLQNDWQIRANSPFRDQRAVLDKVIAAMAREAAPEMRLIVKLHPMDVGMIDWGAETAAIARRHGVAERVHFVDGGDLAPLMAGAVAVFVVNSTVGLHALRAGRPVKAFGAAIYDMPGLTDQRELGQIWQAPMAPDARLVESLVRLLAASIQIRGSFYAPEGRREAVAEIVRRVTQGLVNEPGAFVDPPPRLARLSAAVSRACCRENTTGRDWRG